MPISLSRFNQEFPSVPWSTAQPTLANPYTASGPAEAAAQAGRAAAGVAGEVMHVASVLQGIEDRTDVVNATASFENWARDYTIGKKKLSGKNAVGLSPIATSDFESTVKTYLSGLKTQEAKSMFIPHAQAIMNSHLNVLANHELGQLEKYRTDTMNAAYANAFEDIKLSTGDPATVNSVIAGYEAQLGLLYQGQDVTDLKKYQRSMLEKAGREAQMRYAETRAYDVMRAKFAKPNAQGIMEMDYGRAKDYLMSNPDNNPSIGILTWEQRERLANSIWMDGERSRALMVQGQEKLEGTMWNMYLKLLTKQPMGEGEPQTFQEWNKLAERYQEGGQIRPSVLQTVISYEKSMESLNRQLKAAEEAAIRRERHESRLEAERARRENPFIMSDPNIMAPLKARILAHPESFSPTEILAKVGKGVSIQDADDMIKTIVGAPAKTWSSPTGKFVYNSLILHRNNSKFSTDSTKNNAGFAEATTHFQKWLQDNPTATQEQADREVRQFMYPYVRSSFGQWYDHAMGNPRILEGR